MQGSLSDSMRFEKRHEQMKDFVNKFKEMLEARVD